MNIFAFQCKFCKTTFSSKNKLKLHYVLYCPSFVNARVKCGYCKSDFLSLDELKNHWNVFFCRKFCICYDCNTYFNSLPIIDGFVNNIYICMFTKKNINVCEDEIIQQLKYFSTFGNSVVKRARVFSFFHKIK